MKSSPRTASGARVRRKAASPSALRGRGARGDGGFTIVEAVTAGSILVLAVAAAAAAISAGSKTRTAASDRLAASEVANEVMQTAEAFGCGLPPGYNGVSAADRELLCDYDGDSSTTDDRALADADFTLERGGFKFDVQVRMKWDIYPPRDVKTGLGTKRSACNQFNNWVRGTGSDPVLNPNMLTRTVTVTAKRAGSAVLTSTQAVDPKLAELFQHHVLTINGTGANNTVDPKVTLRRTEGGSTYDYVLHLEPLECAMLPYLENRTGVSYALHYTKINCTNNCSPSITHANLICSTAPCWKMPYPSLTG